MKRKLIPLFLALLAVLPLTLPASADMIWEPQDSFYEKHRDECDYVNRNYQMAGYDGTVALYTAPGGTKKAALDNGLQAGIQFTWTGNGLTWGYLVRWGDNPAEGWVPMDDLSLVYDSQSFMVDHAGEITQAALVPVDFHEAVLYGYPRGPVWENTLTEDADYQPFSEVFTETYTDEDGLRWGYVGYYMGHCDAWVCLDDPMNRELDTGIIPVEPSPAQVRGSATQINAGTPPFVYAAVLVAAVVVVTAVLILKLKKRNSEREC